jgi:glucosamine 6-phosphate synthetase-like amidotransferase/phosphosugar isomerase protein
MCGIVAAARLNTKASDIKPDVQEEIMRFWHTELMMLTEERGKDAAGSALLWEDGSLLGIKHGTSVSNLICDWDPDDKKKSYLAFMRVWRKYNAAPVSVAIGHCRKLSVGTAWKNENNHPHYVGKKMVLIHNGTLKNHHKLKTAFDITCKGDTDSEVIANLVYMANHKMPKKKDKGIFTMDQAEWVVDKLEGTFSCIAMNADNPYQFMAFRDNRPFEMAFSAQAGLLFVASESKFFTSVLARYERFRRYYGMTQWPDLDLRKLAMPDDNAWIVNLKETVDEDTKMADLIESKAMPKSAQRDKDLKTESKGWTNTAYQGGVQNNRQPASSIGGGVPRTQTQTEKDKKDGDVETREIGGKEREVSATHKNGFIWHPGERIYVKQTFGDLEDGKVAEVPSERLDTVSNEKTAASQTEVEDLTTTVKEDDDKKAAGVESVPASEIVDEEKIVKTVEEATKTHVKLEGHYNTLAEIGKDIEENIDHSSKGTVSLEHKNSTKTMDLRSIASRIRNAVSGRSFAAGWKACEEAAGFTASTMRSTVDSLSDTVEKENRKKKRAQDRLAYLKSYAVFTTALLDRLSDDREVDSETIQNAVEMVSALNHRLVDKAIAEIFTDRESAMIGLDKILDDVVFTTCGVGDDETEN